MSSHHTLPWTTVTSATLFALGFVFSIAAGAVEYTQLTSNGEDPCWSRDGTNRIVYSTTHHIYMIPATGGTPIEITDVYAGSICSHPSWSPDGALVAFKNIIAPGFLMCPAIAGGDTGAVFVASEYWMKDMRWSPTGSRFVMCYDSEIWVCPAEESGWDARERIVWDTPGGPIHPCWSPNDQQVAFDAYPPGSGYREIYVVDSYGGGDPQAITTESGNYTTSQMPDWSADGSWICFVRTWWYNNYELTGLCLATGELVTLIPAGTFSGIDNPVLSEDGSSVVFQAEGGIYVASGLEWPCPVSVRETSWGVIKALYR